VIGLPSHKPKAKTRRNWNKEFKAERNKVIDEAISAINKNQRDVPEVWRRGYSSAITTLELMKSKESK
jgi:nicotinic acid mononucleotide adenylyltransferase